MGASPGGPCSRLRPAELFSARFGRVCSRALPLGAGMRLLVQGPPVTRLARRRRPGGRQNPVVPLGQRQLCPEIGIVRLTGSDL